MTDEKSLVVISKELTQVVEGVGLQQTTKVEEMLSHFSGYFAQAKKLVDSSMSIQVTGEDQVDLMATAREKRLELRRVRIDAEKTRKELKDQSWREGKAIDGVSNVIKALIVPVEEHLEKQEKFAEIQQAEKNAKRHSGRIEALSKYVDDVSLYSLEDMADEVFDKLLGDSKRAFEAQQKAERDAEETRIKEEKEDKEKQEAVRLENIKLKADAEKEEDRQAKLEDKRKKETEAQERKVRVEREKREKIEADIKKEKEEREEKARIEREEAEEAKRKALLAPDKDKLIKLAGDIDTVTLPRLESKEAGDVLDKAVEKLNFVSKYIRERSKSL